MATEIQCFPVVRVLVHLLNPQMEEQHAPLACI